ncbi:hypothetical protein F5144DRAFT_85894 [Chaetomium tenue]|uniref:Uncharacterized protein n=1 Tax=Chaetomium tenue TaxID=1854479 RepID=A0ACB7PE66_9PEZI|nr:hypothetical protein F5144DRAFT_85894 [Chaetomium globosum]
MIRTGWDQVNYYFTSRIQLGCSPLLEDYIALRKEILTGVKFDRYTTKQPIQWLLIDFPSELPDFRRRFERLRHLLDNQAVGLQSLLKDEPMIQGWVEDYHLSDAMYHWVCNQIAWIKDNPNAALNNVLNDKRYQF